MIRRPFHPILRNQKRKLKTRNPKSKIPNPKLEKKTTKYTKHTKSSAPLVPTLCVGTHFLAAPRQLVLRIVPSQCDAERRSLAFPRRAWERKPIFSHLAKGHFYFVVPLPLFHFSPSTFPTA